MSYEFTPIAASELHLMKALLAVFADAFAEPHTYLGAIPDDAYLAELLNEKRFIALVASSGGEVVGGLTAYELPKFEQVRSEIYIYDLAVAEKHRRRGVATGLIRALVAMAKERGAYVIFVQADPGDEPAIRLYESLGKREDVHHFDIPVR